MHTKWYISIFSLMLGVHSVSCRKYDIEAEAQKIYGEDLASVLRRFRKTTEYLSILESKLTDLKMNFDIIAANLYMYYERKMDDKVLETLGFNQTDSDNFGRKKMLRAQYPDIRRQGDDTTPPANLTGVEKIDSYKKLRSYLTVEERNKFKDLGFEFAGHIIHDLITALSDDGWSSTLLPFGAEEDTKFSAHDHHVTHETTVEPPSADYATALPDTFRHYKPQNIL